MCQFRFPIQRLATANKPVPAIQHYFLNPNNNGLPAALSFPPGGDVSHESLVMGEVAQEKRQGKLVVARVFWLRSQGPPAAEITPFLFRAAIPIKKMGGSGRQSKKTFE